MINVTEKYQKLELERKKCRTVKKVYTGPTIRYHSISMPLLGDDGMMNCCRQTVEGRYERTFITFSDADTMVSAFPSNDPPKPPSKNFCPITRVPAKYLDPVTHLPYCNIATFRVLREAYYQQLEARGDRGSAEIAAWLAHRQTSKTAQTIKMDPSMLQITKFKEEPDKNVPCESSACLPVLTSLPTIPLARIPLPEDIVSITSPTKPMKM
ncbi:Vacuolar protein sorting-associated protein 72 [Homalodisca vitripennis]|nr:Vacuolar protein sorting-associated protein 72 [Homalodisca vitripennis]